jgi:hypothetical protein
LCAAAVVAGGVLVMGQQLPEPRKQFGAGVTGAFEGWFTNKDGSRGFLVGYYNRNSRQTLDVPIGPDNRIEPGGPDVGQPTHFLPGRQYGMFVVPVPKTFGPNDRLTWTIVANGQSASIPLRLHPDYVIEPFSEIAVGNTPPAVRFEEKGAAIQGPIAQVGSAVVVVETGLCLVTDDRASTSVSNAPLNTPPRLSPWLVQRVRATSSSTRPARRPSFQTQLERRSAERRRRA